MESLLKRDNYSETKKHHINDKVSAFNQILITKTRAFRPYLIQWVGTVLMNVKPKALLSWLFRNGPLSLSGWTPWFFGFFAPA